MAKESYMFVYFNELGEIKCIAPQLDTELNHLQHALFPMTQVEPFMIGVKNMHTHLVVKDKKDPTIFTIQSKEIEINEVKTLDRFLTEVRKSKDGDYHLKVTHNVLECKVIFRISRKIQQSLLLNESVDTDRITVNGIPVLDFYFTLNGDPSFLIHEISIPTNRLINEQQVEIHYDPKTINIKGTSVFTKKVFEKYSYEEI